ncbi:MAG: PKD domain-containing protein [Bacteroidales bacterium]|nr:PKD domain-containing protein [Bacteroidales bacterium]
MQTIRFVYQNRYETESLELIPGTPVENEEIYLVAHTVHPSGGCNLIDYSIWRYENQIFIEPIYEQGLATYICHSVDTFSIGKLKAGKYLLIFPYSDSLFFSVKKDSNACEADFNFTYPKCYEDSAKCGKNSVVFHDVSFGNVVSWKWDFGDGTTSDESNPFHMYQDTGIYNVCLTIETSSGCTSQICKEVPAGMVIPDCKARFTWKELNEVPILSLWPMPVHVIQLTDQSYGNINSWIWDFSDSTSSTEQNPIKYVYGEEIYVSLAVSGPNGCSDQTAQYINFKDTGDCHADFSWYNAPEPIYNDTLDYTGSFRSYYPPYNHVQFIDQSRGNIESWYWKFDNGYYSDLQNPEMWFTNDGIYNIELTIKTYSGCTDTRTKTLTLGNNHCDVEFVWEEVYPNCVDSTNSINCISPYHYVQFATYISSDFYSYYWDFGDGSFSVDRAPLHEYTSDGIYTVTLYTKGLLNECAGVTSQTIVLGDSLIRPCNADFVLDTVPFGCPECANCYCAQFINTSGVHAEYEWDFGDNNTSDAEHPDHVYQWSSGQKGFIVRLIMKNEYCADTIYKAFNPEDYSLTDIEEPAMVYDVKIHPNPVKGDVFIELTGGPIDDDIILSVYDVFGREVDLKKYHSDEAIGGKMIYNVAHLTNGQYICIIKSARKVFKGRFVVDK